MATTIRGLLFDFDGLILDTETPELQVWKKIYAEYGFEYPVQLWSQNVGFWGNSGFDPVRYLHELTKDSLDQPAIRRRHHDESSVLIEREPVRPGVQAYLSEARQLGLRVAVASSSPRHWVEPHLTRLGLVDRFDTIITGESVAPGRVKPFPDIYLKALEQVGLKASEAIALEDSPPGVAAAHAAGVFVVAVHNPSTVELKHPEADLVISSLADLDLKDLLKRATR
jgi:HAD superfamily hydrolase (TIGR01509 family)